MISILIIVQVVWLTVSEITWTAENVSSAKGALAPLAVSRLPATDEPGRAGDLKWKLT